ncbi:MAG TPA: Xaa-Pro aminopeptidase [Patescibacteria group bacterium]|nr:Xaa-Pro aminopeptidase [Patescibacteria group bacterium]
MLSEEFFAGNRQRLRELFTGTAPIVVTANGLLQRGGDSAYPFHQDANFWYLTGVDEPDIVLVMDRDKEYLILPSRDTDRETFDGSLDDASLKRRSGVQLILEEKEGWKQLGARLQRAKHVATIAASPGYIERYGMYTNPARAQLIQKVKAENEQIGLLDLTMHLVRMRMVKQQPEIAAIQTAIDTTISSIKESLKTSKRGKYTFEYELEAEITKGFRKRGARHAYEPIVASGPRACVLHNIANDSQLVADELVLLDVGAEVEHYAADITRTVSLATPSRRQQAVYAAVLEVQEYAMAHLRAGAFLQVYEQKVEHFMGEKLRELGLIKTIDHENVRRYYPHATSHFLGLTVHDVGDYTLPLAAGNVLTVEPGIYIPEEGIGIRIEDDVLITENGIEILSDGLPRALP